MIMILLVILYVFDLLVCFCYCSKKKQIDKNKAAIKTLSDSYEVPYEKVNGNIVTKIKNYLNGYILFRVRRLGQFPSQKYRIILLKHIFRMDIEDKVVIYHWDTIRAPWNIKIGRGSIIGDGAKLDGRNTIIIGQNVNLSTGVNIYTEQHDVNDPFFRSLSSGGSVVIDDRAWISSHTTILPSVHIGEGAILASGGLACKDLDAFGIYGGVPCKRIADRNNLLEYEFEGDYVPFF